MTVQYLIDSENVGDFWIPLLELPGQDTELIVFYTRNSPHMSYDSLIRLKESDRTVTFIKCYEGTNALDFQLVSELGYRISKDEDGRFIIVTNDTGFDAAVKYWRRRKKSVKRITGKECKNLERRLREDLSIGTSRTHTADLSDHADAETDHDEEQEVQTELIRTEADADHEARPSGPNLRDAERAAQPDPDESDTADSEYMADVDFDDEEVEEEDPHTFDQFVEDRDDLSEESEEDDLQDDDAFDIGQEESEENSSQASTAEEDVEAEDAEEMPVEEAAENRDTDAGDHAEEARLDFTAVEDAAEGEPAADGFDDIQAAQEKTADGQLTDEQKAGDSIEDVEIEEQEIAEQETASDPSLSGEIAVQADDDTEQMQETSDMEEEPASETGHRSKSRRSRSRRSKSTARKQEQASDDYKAVAASTSGKDSQKHDSSKENADEAQDNSSDALPAPGDDEIARIVACIGAENLAELHNQLATFYGEQGKEIYLSIKNNSRSLPVLKPDLKQKFEYYCEIIFRRSDYSGEYPSDISEYLLNVREKLNNLNSLRYALQKHYGKEKGRRFYFLLKPFAKTMYQM